MGIKLGVLFGGQSHEHPVSLMSVSSVLANLDEKYDIYMVGITRDGCWLHYSGSIDKIENGDWEKDPENEEVILSTNPAHHGFYETRSNRYHYVDVIFPVLHGRNGEDGTIQGLCQLNGIPCVSCDITSSAIAMDKEFTHLVAESYGVPMARYMPLHRSDLIHVDKLYEMLTEKFGLPFYVKPSKEGSSFGAHKITDRDSFAKGISDAFAYDEKILAEEFISGTEVGCGILGDDITGEVFEVVVETEMYGYEEKYDGYMTNIYVPSKNLTREQMDEVKRLAKIVYKALGCNVMGRADFFAGDRIVFNEINLIPGFTSHSLYPASFKGAGTDYRTLLNMLIDAAMKRDAHE
ncbi:MAG: D-alanine--D-alanine ligase [Erysipelotrichaceae bacterium]|nr:D-alanine--D-alanine ligase [Erysipelotrichaceae bacterium]